MITASVRGALLAGALLPLSVRADAPAAAPLLDEPAVAALALALSVSPTPELDVGVTPGGAPELELTATIEVAAVTFAEVPRIRVSLEHGPQRVRWRTERSNLPDRVEPGVEYRDVTVKLALSGGPEQIQALLADARRIAAGIRVQEVAAGPTATPTPAPTPAAAESERPLTPSVGPAEPARSRGAVVPTSTAAPASEAPAPAAVPEAAPPPPAPDAPTSP